MNFECVIAQPRSCIACYNVLNNQYVRPTARSHHLEANNNSDFSLPGRTASQPAGQTDMIMEVASRPKNHDIDDTDDEKTDLDELYDKSHDSVLRTSQGVPAKYNLSHNGPINLICIPHHTNKPSYFSCQLFGPGYRLL